MATNQSWTDRALVVRAREGETSKVVGCAAASARGVGSSLPHSD